jgi:hypothetical protein
MIEIPNGQRDTKLWRYMSFDRFAWLLLNRALFLSRLDFLEDAWEGAPSALQLKRLVDLAKDDIGPGKKFPDGDVAVLSQILYWRRVRQSAYVSCWTRGEGESHALWSMYCGGTRQGVVVQTTWGRLRDSLPAHVEVVPVGYEPDRDQMTDPLVVVSQKRAPFVSEREVRIVWLEHKDVTLDGGKKAIGREVRWNPGDHLEGIRVHPGAQPAFLKTVEGIVRALAAHSTHRDQSVHAIVITGTTAS